MADFITPYATRLCLSGAESRRLLDTFRDFGVKHIQVSFYYLRRVFGDPLEFEEYSKSFHTVIIDSGTVYGNVKNQEEKDDLLRDYASYLAALNKKSFTAAVYEEGYDLHKILPDEALIYPLDQVRDTFDNDLPTLFKNIKYVGVSNKECTAGGGENLIPIFAAGAREGAYIHAFGTGSRKILSKYPFYSANSSSWRTGSRYLNTYIYEGPSRGLRLYQPTDKKDPVKTEREIKTIRRRQSNLTNVRTPDVGSLIDWDAVIEAGESWAVDQANLAQWLLYVQDLGFIVQNKYFLVEEQRQDILLRRKDLLAKGQAAAHTQEGGEVDGDSRDNSDGDMGHISNRDDMGEGKDREEESPVEEGEIVEGDAIEEGRMLPATDPIEDLLGPSTANTALTPHSKGRYVPVDERMRVVRQCNDCILAGRCPKYAPDSPCSYGLDPHDPSYDVANLEGHIMEDAADLLAIMKDRIMQAYLEEKVDASGLSKDLSTALKQYMEMVQLLSEATDKRDEVTVRAKGTGALDMFRKKT